MGSMRLESCLRIAVAIEATLVACMDAAGTISSFAFIYSLYRKQGSGVPDFWNYWGKEWISVLARVLFFFVVAYLGWRRSRRFPLFAMFPSRGSLRMCWPCHTTSHSSCWARGQRSLSSFTLPLLFGGQSHSRKPSSRVPRRCMWGCASSGGGASGKGKPPRPQCSRPARIRR